MMNWIASLPTDRISFERAIGVCIILFACYNRFYTPTTNRSSTTAVRFHLAAFCYAVSSVIAHIILIMWPEYLNLVVKFTPETPLPDVIQNLEKATPLTIGVAIGLVLPTLPHFNKVDQSVRKWFERRAAIPTELSALADRLASDELTIDADHCDRVNKERNEFFYGVLPDAVVAKPSESLSNAVTRLICLRLQLEDWGTTGRGRRALFEADDLKLLRVEFESHRDSVCAYMRIRSGAIAPNHEAMVALRRAVLDSTRSLTQAFAVFTSRTALTLFFTHETPLDRFTVFQLKRPKPFMDWNKWALVFMSLFVTIMACMTASVLLEATGDKSPGEMYGTGIMIYLIFIWATVCSVAPRRYLRGRPAHGGELPWLCYLASCVLSVVGAFAISFMFRLITHAVGNSTIAAAWSEQMTKWPFLVLPLGVSLAVTFLLDVDVPFVHRPVAASLTRGLCVGALIAGLAVLAHELLHRIGAPSPPPMALFTVTCFAIGALVGALVPHYYRRAHRSPRP